MRGVDVKEGAGRRKQGRQYKDMLATVVTPIRFALRSIQTTGVWAQKKKHVRSKICWAL